MSEALRARRRRRSWATSRTGGLVIVASFSLACWAALFSTTAAALLALGVTAWVSAVVIRDVFYGGRA